MLSKIISRMDTVSYPSGQALDPWRSVDIKRSRIFPGTILAAFAEPSNWSCSSCTISCISRLRCNKGRFIELGNHLKDTSQSQILTFVELDKKQVMFWSSAFMVASFRNWCGRRRTGPRSSSSPDTSSPASSTMFEMRSSMGLEEEIIKFSGRW